MASQIALITAPYTVVGKHVRYVKGAVATVGVSKDTFSGMVGLK